MSMLSVNLESQRDNLNEFLIHCHRQTAVNEARSWIGTPYSLGKKSKGAGVDCALLLLAVYQVVGIIPLDEPNHKFKSDWFCHTQDEKYTLRALRYARKTLECRCRYSVAALPGDPVLVKAVGSRVYNHGGVVTHWPFVVHATKDGVKEDHAMKHELWAHHELMVLDPWAEGKIE